MLKKDALFHLQCDPARIGRYCILPGDPGRCEAIAAHLEGAEFCSRNREYTIYTGHLLGRAVTVCSTGIGGPSSAIALEELHMAGADTFLRVGTCGGIAKEVSSGDCVVATGAVRQDGTSAEYAPLAFPAVANYEVLFALVEAAKASGYPWHAGVVQSKDSFYGQHDPHRMPTEKALLSQWEAWIRLGVLASEMEAAAQFTAGAALGVRTGAVFHTIWNQEREATGLPQAENHDTSRAIEIAVDAVRRLIASDEGRT